ncbi:hypothetical protein [Lysobacter sp. TY2-98]|uniref:hypothetical protein n=1 Tax=Lysobacter sp. TY2-98 TaxID=2290922 RepID=UPI0013B36E4F|nr:hypothetical protein [Lysobacter sp. TY2-98]
MIRRLLIPLAATAVLAGCVTTPPYGYRADGQGDYYYGSPSVEYRYHDAWPYYGFGYPYYYGPYRPGFSVWGGYYGGYYGGGYPYYGYPYYGGGYHYTYPNYHPRPRPDNNNGGNHDRDGGGHRPDGGPWRNPDEIVRRRRQVDNGGGMVQVAPRPAMPEVTRPDPGPRMGGERSGSPAGDVIRRARRESAAENDPR